ncbi:MULTISPECIES: hypothetical protein [Citrobacter]|uniref:hypothetical protein n=1 Tax=Citrobacter TaxID=544 RepID=UPI00129AA1F0|nr:MULTISPECIES: hypothetical protein [Citrobacter]MBW7618015.1 hypothetical protein [Citrobacter portucalensis]MBW7637229.1 hypothetical protein [Citrobacter portucalensis]MCA2131314.1 hypothetical protein [Citrobacter portucalensis]MCA2141493.1 hypothetical protein [Citrobacter portucalensis]MCA2147084.1 hypothetical protein [Citrobacter portucalensis]
MGKKATIIVLYNPDINGLLHNVNIISGIVDYIIIIDNTPSEITRQKVKDSIFESCVNNETIFYSGCDNIGLSRAYNEGVEIINKKCDGVEAVLFLDQDSDVSHETLENLWQSYDFLIKNYNLGMVGACPVRVDGLAYRYSVKKSSLNLPTNLREVNRVISSFSIVPLNVLNKLNGFYDDFFIDHIDNDFSRRCIKNNMIVVIDVNTKFIQRIGESSLTLFGKHISPVSSPFRHYYQARNIILSARRCGDKFVSTIPYLVKRAVVINLQGIFKGQFWVRNKYFILGLYHGIINKSGKLK